MSATKQAMAKRSQAKHDPRYSATRGTKNKRKALAKQRKNPRRSVGYSGKKGG